MVKRRMMTVCNAGADIGSAEAGFKHPLPSRERAGVRSGLDSAASKRCCVRPYDGVIVMSLAEEGPVIRKCQERDLEAMYQIVNDAAQAYRGVIPADRWHEPYMSLEHLQQEIEAGVVFWGSEEQGQLQGVMGIQNVQDVTLVRHAYVRTAQRGKGIGSMLIKHLKSLSDRPMLVGTWAAATWAVRFYEQHGFFLVTQEEKDHLLRKYWSIPVRQTETSVVLVDERRKKQKARATTKLP
jgi:N-acetylglutamate synthase-like GNAT family acetyltransferase